MEEGASLWAPGSPRLSFSRDFVQSEVFNPSSSTPSLRDPTGAADSSDFDFGMLAMLRSRVDPPPVVHADELFRNGKLLPRNPEVQQHDHLPGVRSSLLHSSARAEQQPQQQVSSPAPSSRRWRDFLSFRRSSDTSSSSSSSSSRSSKLKLLFRSSSAGAGGRHESECEPSLGRSASESKATTSCSGSTGSGSGDLPNASACYSNIIRGRAEVFPSIPTPDEKIKSKRRVPKPSGGQSQSQSQPSRRALAEVKAGSRSMSASSAPNYQRLLNSSNSLGSLSSRQNCLNQGNNGTFGGAAACPGPVKGTGRHHGRSSSTSSVDAWRAYSERTGSTNSSGGVKVAEVLHMEVCMGQSTVVSKVAKAFMKKENHNSKIGVTA